MLWSLVKIVFFIALVALLAFGLNYWMDAGQGFTLQVAGEEFSPNPLQAVVVVVLLFLAVWLVIRLVGLLVAFLRFLSGDETAISRWFDRNRERKGYEALADAMLALASGEGARAMAKASKAERYLRRPQLTNLINAQAAELMGDSKKAEGIYKQLLSDDKTRFVGVRGLMKQQLEAGETETALKLAEKAFLLKPKHEETQDILLGLQAEGEDWAGARTTLAAKLRHGSIPRDMHRRRDAVLALADASNPDNDDAKTNTAALEAHRLSPDLIPATIMASRAHLANGSKRKASKAIRKAWATMPHPDLAAAFAAIEPEETPEARVKRFAALIKTQPEHDESRMLQAELLIAAEDFPSARKALGDITEHSPTARALTIMAAIERGEGADNAVVQGWLARAVTARRGPAWVCDKCNTAHHDWAPLCKRCQGVDTLTWKDTTSEDDPVLAAATSMLPLITAPQITTEPAEDVTPLIDDATDDAEIISEDSAADETTPDEAVKPST